MLDDLKLLLGLPLSDSSKDELLELLINQATNEAKMITSIEDLTPGLKVCIIKMAIYNYNRMGTEGLSSESYSGTSYSYTDGYPEEIKELLEQCRLSNGSTGAFKILW